MSKHSIQQCWKSKERLKRVSQEIATFCCFHVDDKGVVGQKAVSSEAMSQSGGRSSSVQVRRSFLPRPFKYLH